MTIKEWKDEFAELYRKMKEDIGAERLEINIEERAVFQLKAGGGMTTIKTCVKIEA